MSVDVCYLISHGFAARMILHSKLLPELRKQGLSVAIMFSSFELEEFPQEIARMMTLLVGRSKWQLKLIEGVLAALLEGLDDE